MNVENMPTEMNVGGVAIHKGDISFRVWKITWGVFFTVVALNLIYYANKRLKEQFNHRNVSLNILNVLIYRSMIICLCF